MLFVYGIIAIVNFSTALAAAPILFAIFLFMVAMSLIIAAASMPERIRHLVYLDAAIPDPGQSLFDLFTSTGSDPLSFTRLQPARAYIEKIKFEPRNLESIPKTYILCIKTEIAPVTHVAR